MRSISGSWLMLALALLVPLSCAKSKSSEDTASSKGPPSDLLAEFASWKSIGGVLDPRELKPKPLTAGAVNAADLYASVAGAFDGLSAGDSALLDDPWEATPRSLQYLLESFDRHLPVIHEALAVPYCNWGTHVEQGRDASVEYLRQVRSMARLLAIEAIVRANSGDLEGAAGSLKDIMRLADQGACESHVMGILMRNALDALATDTARRIFAKSDSIPSGFSEALARRAYATYVGRALIYEGSIAVATVRTAAGGNAIGPVEEQAIPKDLADGLIWYLSTLRSYIDELNQPYFQRTAASRRSPMPSSARLPDGLARFEDIDRICRVGASIENQCAVTSTAIQLRAYRKVHGEYPDPQSYSVPTDALTGKPIEYLKYTDGFLLRASMAGLRGESADYEWEW